MFRRVKPFCLTLILLACSAPLQAYDFDHVWTCELRDGRTLDEARAASRDWLKAAHSMPNGDQLKLYIHWPIIAGVNERAFNWVIRAPSLTYWGTFYDGYHLDSPAALADEKFAEIATCTGSMMWEMLPIE